MKRKPTTPAKIDKYAEIKQELEEVFPNLAQVGYAITSPKDGTHNCIAYAVGDTTRKWCGFSDRHLTSFGYYWPPDAKPGKGIQELINAYESIGFSICNSGNEEEGFDKVAIYIGDDGRWKHAAKQISGGRWSSKIGVESVDIMHKTPHALSGSIYGQVVHYMKRPVVIELIEQDEESESDNFSQPIQSKKVPTKRARRSR